MVPCFTALLTTLIVSLTTVNGNEAARAVVVAATPFVNSNEPWTISLLPVFIMFKPFVAVRGFDNRAEPVATRVVPAAVVTILFLLFQYQ